MALEAQTASRAGGCGVRGWGGAGAGVEVWRIPNASCFMLHGTRCVPYDEIGEFGLDVGLGLAMTKGSIEPFLELVLLGLIVNC